MNRLLDLLAKVIVGTYFCMCGLALIVTVGILGYLGYDIVGMQGMLAIVAAGAALVWAILRIEP